MMLFNVRRMLAFLLAVAMLSFIIACGKSDDDDAAEDDSDAATETAAAGTPYKVSGNEGSITGTVNFAGTAPEPKPISMDADAACAQNNPNPHTEDVVVKDGKLANVLVYIKDGKTADGKAISGLAFPVTATEAALDQKGCHYSPHVLAVMAGQKIKITNSDPTAHNVHPLPKSNKEWNQSQPAGAQPIIQTFIRAEVVVPVKCNQHPWMKANIGVLKHPLFAVSAENGSFEIKGVPPGTYTVATWHEKYGEKTQSVTVGAKETKPQDFSYDASGGQSASLEVLPAIEFPMFIRH